MLFQFGCIYIARSALSLSIREAVALLVLFTCSLHCVAELLHGTIVGRGYGSRHCPNISLMFSHTTSSGQPTCTFQGPHQCLLNDQVRAKASPMLIGTPYDMESIHDFWKTTGFYFSNITIIRMYRYADFK